MQLSDQAISLSLSKSKSKLRQKDKIIQRATNIAVVLATSYFYFLLNALEVGEIVTKIQIYFYLQG